MSDVDARYLGLTANQLAKIATDFKAENAKLRELAKSLLASHDKMCTQRGNCFGCQFFIAEPCPFVKLSQALRELGIEVTE